MCVEYNSCVLSITVVCVLRKIVVCVLSTIVVKGNIEFSTQWRLQRNRTKCLHIICTNRFNDAFKISKTITDILCLFHKFYKL